MYEHPFDQPGIRRMCLAADLRGYSSRDDVGQVELQRALPAALAAASGKAGLDRAHWIRQEQGDGELALMPPGIDEAWTLAGLTRELRAWLHHYNRDRKDSARLRVRLAAHEGIVYTADNGFAGEAVVTVSRLCNAEQAKQALADNPRADLVLIVSERIYNDVVSQNIHGLLAEEFAEVEVRDRGKNFSARAWVSLPGQSAFRGEATRTDARGDVSGEATQTNTQGDVSGEAVAARDIRDVSIHDHRGDQHGDHHGDQYGSRHGEQHGDRYRDHHGDRYGDITLNQPTGVNFGGKHNHYGEAEGR
ncbi:hypothetical protein ACOALZ_20420 [Nocardiopsis algeriensis]|uniref:hypothetical protein n=1 Tax=Nocardiopsis algeriensis TaxID=1478215 RepID=UPI003B4386D4